MKIRETHIDCIESGHTILHNNKVMTVTKKDIKNDRCVGKTIFGDSYMLGYKKVKLIIQL